MYITGFYGIAICLKIFGTTLSEAAGVRLAYDGLTESCSGPEVGFGEIVIDLLQPVLWIVSGLPTIASRSCVSDAPGSQHFFRLPRRVFPTKST